MPDKNKRVLIYYKKNKQYIMTEGYLTDIAENLATESHDVDFWRGCGRGLTWFDTQRQIQSLTAKKSKNEVLFWTEKPEEPI